MKLELDNYNENAFVLLAVPCASSSAACNMAEVPSPELWVWVLAIVLSHMTDSMIRNDTGPSYQSILICLHIGKDYISFLKNPFGDLL